MWGILLLVTVLIPTDMAEGVEFLRSEIVGIMQQNFQDGNSIDAFNRSRYFLPTGNVGRDRMQAFIKHKFSSILGLAGGREAGHTFHERPFQTTVQVANKITQVTGINYIAVLSPKENKTRTDRPLVILANYDTDKSINVENPVEENGSGVASLLVIGTKLANEIHSKRITIKSTIILAAVDGSLGKYALDGTVEGANSGSWEIANKFLPEFLTNRPKGLQGVIVLDNLMNYHEWEKSQRTPGIDRSYPEAYHEISVGGFAGNFLALVARGDDIDRALVNAVAKKWNETTPAEVKPARGTPDEPVVVHQPRLIKFLHEVRNGQGEGFFHFLKSDQTPFWNYRSDDMPPYPAILLTDTRTYREPVCARETLCDNFKETTSAKNIEFALRAIQTVYKTTVHLQANAGSIILPQTVTATCVLICLYFKIFNY